MSIESMRKFGDAIRDLLDYYASEFNLTYAEAIGVLQMTIMDVHAESMQTLEEDGNGESVEEGD